MIKQQTYIREDQKADLESVSDKTGAPVAELIRRAIDKYLKENK